LLALGSDNREAPLSGENCVQQGNYLLHDHQLHFGENRGSALGDSC
jgi:hypothetical protein